MGTEVLEVPTAPVDLSKLSAKELAALAKAAEEREAVAHKESKAAFDARQWALTETIVEDAVKVSALLAIHRNRWEGLLEEFTDYLRQYSHREGDWKGNLTLYNEAKTMKLEYSIQQLGDYDARANEGAQLIIEYIEAAFAGNDVLKMVTSLLQPKSGKFDRDNILRLLKMEDDFIDERWKRGLQLLRESYTSKGTKAYIRAYQRPNEKAQWETVSLSIANV
jgi:hypothetical protein